MRSHHLQESSFSFSRSFLFKVAFILLLSGGMPRLQAQCIATFPYSEGFELAPAWTAGGTNSDWAWGTPAHPTISTAGGGSKSWCVGGLSGSAYSNSEQSWLRSPCFDFSTLTYPWISFKIFWECERQWDGMVLQSSINNGMTWQNVGAFGDPVNCMNDNWYNYNNISWLTTASPKHGWSGRIGATVSSCQGGFGSGGWVTAKHCLTGLAGQPNVIFRFLFGSGTTCNSYDGMAVDDIYIANAPPETNSISYACGAAHLVSFTSTSTPCATSYAWNFGDPSSAAANTSTLQNPSHTFSAAGTYTITLTTNGPCNPPATATTVVTILSASTTVTSVTCNGANDGSAMAIVTGGSGPFTYSWSPSGGNAASASGLSPGTYVVNVSAANACPVSATAVITQPPVLTAGSSQVNVLCHGQCTGSATVTPSGGTPSYSYLWSPSGGTGATANNLCAGTYTCTVTDSHGCTTLNTITITEPATGITVSPSQTNVSCHGGNNGFAMVTASGGTGPYTYSWSPSGGNGNSATNLIAGIYTCITSDASGCSVSQIFIIAEPAVLSATTSFVNPQCNGGTGSATVVVSGGTGPYTYNWTPSGGNAAVSTPLVPGNYTCSISDANACTLTETFLVVAPAVLTAGTSQVDETCNGGNTGSASVSVSGGTGPYTYSWSPSGGNGASASGLTAGTYTCLITDAHSCTLSETFSITEPTALVASTSTSSATCSASNGTATVSASGGTGPYTYSWSSGGTGTTETGLAVGSYTVTVTCVGGCTVTAVAVVAGTNSVSAAITSFTNVSCYNGTNGDATAAPSGGTAPYVYAWSPSGGNAAQASSLAAGNYTCTITDFNGCVASASVTITQAAALTLTASQTNVACSGGSSGSASVLVSGGTGPYSYNWSPSGGNGIMATGLVAGTYTCNITDAHTCALTQSFTITEPPQLTLSISGFNVSCNNSCDGQVVVIPSGGTPNYTFAWNNGNTSASCSNVCAGAYSVTVSDANGCTAIASTSLTQPPAIVINTSATDAHCNHADGAASAIAAGGSGTLNFQWLGGPATASYNNIAAGTYSVVVTDANGCADTSTALVNNLNGVTAALVSSTNLGCNNSNNGAVLINATGGNGPYLYSWTPNVSSSNSATGIPAGNYQVVVTDNDGCTSTLNTVLTQPTPLTVNAVSNSPNVCLGSAVQLSALASGGTAGYSYSWNPGALTGNVQNLVPAATSTYTVYATDANGCADSSQVTVTVHALPTALLSANTTSGCAPLCVNFSDLSTVAAPDAISSWSWDFGDNSTTAVLQNPAHCYNTGGTYDVSLTVSTTAGCTATLLMPAYIHALVSPVAAFGASPQPTTILNPIITFSDSSSNAVSWNWNFGDVLQSSSTLQDPVFIYHEPDCYQVLLTVTSADGCTDATTKEVCLGPDVALYMPNAFTPNNDGQNDFFYPKGEGIDWATFHMQIFDRWGNLVYKTDDINKPWDGKAKNGSEIAQQDVYVWKLDVKDTEGGNHNLMGHVTLLK